MNDLNQFLDAARDRMEEAIAFLDDSLPTSVPARPT